MAVCISSFQYNQKNVLSFTNTADNTGFKHTGDLCSLCLCVGGQKLAKEYGALENAHEKTRDFFVVVN